MRQLPIFLNLSGRTVVLVGEGEAADAKARLIGRAGGRVVPAWEAGATIAFVALDKGAEAVAADLRARGLLVNVVDRPDLCDFTTPAIVDRAPVTIAVGTGGASAGLAKAVRQRIEALLPARLGALAAALHVARGAMKARWPAAADRRRAIDAAL
ncbi:precorrin-2 dehydrogenase/sirohydrochlorin ferrochelatase family protein, partial [Sphingopyxis granuli]